MEGFVKGAINVKNMVKKFGGIGNPTDDMVDDEKKFDRHNDSDEKLDLPVLKNTKERPIHSVYADCMVAPRDDMESLAVSLKAFDAVSSMCENVVSLVGNPGMGKSTLSSTIYNIMRGTNNEYYEISDSMDSFTKGIWSLNAKYKQLMADKDKIDVFDLEGIENEDAIHYLVLVSMVLSKAILLCNTSVRLPFPVIKTLKTGLTMFKKYNIKVEKPILYIQVPFIEAGKPKEYKLGNEYLTINQLIEKIKEKFPYAKDFEMRTFELPPFDAKKGRFDEKYIKYVKKLIEELQTIAWNTNMPERVRYAKVMIAALNNKSPNMVADINYKLFKGHLESRIELVKAQAVQTMKTLFGTISLSKNVTYDEFIEIGCLKSNENGNLNEKIPKDVWFISDDIKLIAQNMAFYNELDQRQINFIKDYENDIKWRLIDPKPHCKGDYELAMAKYEKKLKELQEKTDKIVTQYSNSFDDFVKLQIDNHIRKIGYRRNCEHIPYQLKTDIYKKKEELRQQVCEQIKDNNVKIPDDFLKVNLELLWQNETDKLKLRWNEQRAKALDRRDCVTTCGSNKCPRCSQEHTNNVGHLECKNNPKNAIYFWVDYPSHMFICSQCHEECSFTGTVCSRCRTSLNNSIISKT